MATFVCAQCLKDIHGEPVWEYSVDHGSAGASAQGAACIAPNVPERVPYHRNCVGKLKASAASSTDSSRDR
jgi:hypothetical protein